MPPKKRPSQDDDNVKVVVRCRCMMPYELKASQQVGVTVTEDSGRITVIDAKSKAERDFTFDQVFGFESKQVDIYNLVARPIVDSVLEGYNGTIFAYGQTGTGKTYTMEGVRSQPENRGIIPNSFAHIFGHIAKAEKGTNFLVRISYMEIYQEMIRDLLAKDKDQHKRLELKEHPDTGVYVKDLSKYVVDSADDLDRLMTLGNKNRVVGKTNMNEHSSRSHAIFSMTIECSEVSQNNSQHIRAGKLNLVDLAGSERQSKTGASGTRLQEASKINLSLSTLANVISALVDGKSSFIPYRNSKLTRLLQDSLGGNSKTLMIANIGPSMYNSDETLSTLRYANRAKNIKNKAIINEDPKDALLKHFQMQIAELKRKLEAGEPLTDEDDYEDYEEYEEVDEIDPKTGEKIKVKKTKRRRKKKDGKIGKKVKIMTKEEIDIAQDKIEAERRRLRVDTRMAEEDKKTAEEILKKREQELNSAEDQQRALEEKLSKIQKKVIVGGEDLLAKHDKQEKLLSQANEEVKKRQSIIEKTRANIERKRQEGLDLEESYKNLKEEAIGKTKKLKKVWTMLIAAKGEEEDMKATHNAEIEDLMESCQELSKQLGLAKLIIESYIPADYQRLIQDYVQWNDQIGEWQMKGVAYTGNNMLLSQKNIENEKKMKEMNSGSSGKHGHGVSAGEGDSLQESLDLTGVYMCYSEASLQQSLAASRADNYEKRVERVKSARKSSRSRERQ